MSNRTSHADFKSVLATGGLFDEKADYGKLIRREVSDQPGFTSRAAFEEMQKKKITMYNPISIPEPHQFLFTAVWPDFAHLWSKSEPGEITEVVKSLGKNIPGYKRITPESIYSYGESDTYYMPSYKPSYFHALQDTQLFSQVFHYFCTNIGLHQAGQHIAALEGYDAEGERDYIWGPDSLHHFGTEYVYASGTMRGQVKRLKDNVEVNVGVGSFHPVKSLKQQNLTFDEVGRLLERFLPLPSYNEEDDYPLAGNYSNFITLAPVEGKMYLVNLSTPFQPDTKAGLPFRQAAKKHQVKWDVIAMANLYLDALTQAVRTQDINAIKKLMKEWWFMSVGYIFPKAERYKLVERVHEDIKFKIDAKKKKYIPETKTETRYETEKTRNIWSMPFISHMLTAQSKVRLDRYPPINIDNSDTPSLYKWSPWKGGMGRLIGKLEVKLTEFKLSQKKRDTFSLIYADNWYLLEMERSKAGAVKARWSSLDQTKGEANVTRSHMAAFENYMLQTCYTSETEGQMRMYYDSTWGYFCRNIVPTLTVNTTGLLGNMLVHVPGQGSGNTNTFFANQTTTALSVRQYELMGTPSMTTQVLNKIAEKTGVDWKIELMTEWDFNEQIKTAKEEGFEAFPKLKRPYILKLDLIGYDAVYNTKLKSFVAVLARDRLFKAAVLPKNFKSENPIVHALYNNVRYNSLILVGAWAYPTLHQALISRITAAFNKVKVMAEYVGGYMNMVKDKIELPFDLIEMKDEKIQVYIGGLAMNPSLEFMEEVMWTGSIVPHQKIGKYVPLKTTDRFGKMRLFVAPGLNISSPFRDTIVYKKINLETDRWADAGDEDVRVWNDHATTILNHGFARFTNFDKNFLKNTQKVGVLLVPVTLNSKLKDYIVKYNLTNNSGLISVADHFQKVDIDEKWAKFKNTMPQKSFVDPTTAGVYFDNKSGRIISDPYKRIHKSQHAINYLGLTKTQKQNVKKSYTDIYEHKILEPTTTKERLEKEFIDIIEQKIEAYKEMKFYDRTPTGVVINSLESAVDMVDAITGLELMKLLELRNDKEFLIELRDQLNFKLLEDQYEEEDKKENSNVDNMD